LSGFRLDRPHAPLRSLLDDHAEYQIRQAHEAGVHDYIYADYLNVDFAALAIELVPVLGLTLLAIFVFPATPARHLPLPSS
jgi:hypothetical protein